MLPTEKDEAAGGGLRVGMIAMPSSRSKGGYLPTLDGWRAIAILGVLGDHVLWGNPHLGPFSSISGVDVRQRQLLPDRKPMIRLGHRLAPPVTSGRGDLQEISVAQNVTA